MKCRIHTIIKQERKRNNCSPKYLQKLEEQCLKNIMKNERNTKNEEHKCEYNNK